MKKKPVILAKKLIGKGKWLHLDTPRHLYNYTPFTIKRILEKVNMQIVYISHFSFEYNIFGMLQTLLNKLNPRLNFFYNVLKRGKISGGSKKNIILSFAINLFLVPILLFPSAILAYFASIFKMGGVIIVYAKKE